MGSRERIQTITNDSDRNRRINQSPISFLLCTEMRFREFLKTVNHQLSASSVCFLENAGFLDMDSVSYYCDYKTIQGSHSELIACEPDVFINSREREDLSSKLLIIANKKTKSFVSVSLYSKEKGIESAPLRNTCHGVIDLSDNGERWEGDILDGYPCGWGRFFNADNMLCYEGFRYKEYTVCYGTGYFPDVFPETKRVLRHDLLRTALRQGHAVQSHRRNHLHRLLDEQQAPRRQHGGRSPQHRHASLPQLAHERFRRAGALLPPPPRLLALPLPLPRNRRDRLLLLLQRGRHAARHTRALRPVLLRGASRGLHRRLLLLCLLLLLSDLTPIAPPPPRRRHAVLRLPSLPCVPPGVVAGSDGCVHRKQLLPEGTVCCVSRWACLFPISVDLPALKRVQVGEASFEGDEENTSLGLLLSNKLILRSRRDRIPLT